MNRRRVLIGGVGLAAAGLGAAAFTLELNRAKQDYAAASSALRVGPSARPEVDDWVRLATLAPNGHNTQPWLFRVAGDRIEILPDFARRTPVVDPDDHHVFVSLGCAAENLAIAAAAAGRRADHKFESATGSIVFDFVDAVPVASPLLAAITQRQSTRAEYDGREVDLAGLKALAEAARVPGVDLVLITEKAKIERVLEFVVAGNSAQMADPAFMRELKSWIRFSPRAALATRDGLYGATSGNPAIPDWVGALLFDVAFRAGAENDKYARHLRSSAGLAVFVSEHSDADHWVRCGRACQRFALQATALGLKLAFVNQPVEVADVRTGFAADLGLAPRRPDLVMRFGYGPALTQSLRRPVDAVVLRG